MVKNQHNRAHMGMDMTEYFDNSRTVNPNRPNLIFGIAAEIKIFGARKGKDIVKKRVAVGEINCRAPNHRQHVRYESLIGLLNDGAFVGRCKGIWKSSL